MRPVNSSAGLVAIIHDVGRSSAAWYVENESGATLSRPELFRLLADAHPGDILLVEQVDRLSPLKAEDWERLKAELTARRTRRGSRASPPAPHRSRSIVRFGVRGRRQTCDGDLPVSRPRADQRNRRDVRDACPSGRCERDGSRRIQRQRCEGPARRTGGMMAHIPVCRLVGPSRHIAPPRTAGR
jgi:hypothetical protein